MESYSTYIYVLIVAIINCFLPIKIQKKTSVLLILFMMLMCGFRASDVGIDTINYVNYAESSYNLYENWGPLYVIMKNFTSFFHEQGIAFLFTMALLTYIPLAYIVKKESVVPSLSVLMYIIPCAFFFNETFNIARQSIAIIYVLISFVLLDKGKIRQSLLFGVIAFLFHPYTIFYGIIYFIRNIEFNRKLVYWTVFTSMAIGLIGSLSGITELLNYMAVFFEDSSGSMLSKFAKYGHGYEIASNFSLIGQLSHMLPIVGLCLLGVNETTSKSILFKAMVCGCVVTNIFVSVIFCERIASTLSISQILVVPLMIKTSSKRSKYLLYCLLALTVLLYIYNLQGYSHDIYWTPYHTCFD